MNECTRFSSHSPRRRARSEVRAQGRAVRLAAPSTLPGLASRTLSPIYPTHSFGASSFGSGRPRGTLQPGVGLPRRSRGSPGDLGTVEWGNAVHVHEPSGISVRNLGEGSVGAHDRTAREGHTKRPCGRFHVSRASRTWETESQHATIIVRLMWRDDTGLDRARRL